MWVDIDTCALSDALDRLAIPGAVAGFTPFTPGTIRGQARTLSLLPARDADSSRVHLGVRLLDAARHGDVIVVSARGRTDAASWGGLLTAAAARAGVTGVIVDGAVRDVDELDEHVPIFAPASTPVTARGRMCEAIFDEPIVIDCVTVSPGDWVVADRNGIVFVPRERAEEVLAVATEIIRRERMIKNAIESGAGLADVLGRDHESMLESS